MKKAVRSPGDIQGDTSPLTPQNESGLSGEGERAKIPMLEGPSPWGVVDSFAIR